MKKAPVRKHRGLFHGAAGLASNPSDCRGPRLPRG
jgi:hypothetical protein